MPDLIKDYASSVVAGFLSRVNALQKLDHKLTKGELRELFVSDVLHSFLSSQFSIGSGIVINQAGTQSRQTDVVIYDNRLLPPFIRSERLGIFPAEAVVATIEVKSRLTAAAIKDAQDAALELKQRVYDPAATIYPKLQPWMSPLCAVVGVGGTGVAALRSLDTGATWLATNVRSLEYIALTGRWSWILFKKGWVGKFGDDTMAYEETKRFIAVLLDNVRTRAEARLRAMAQGHLDLLSAYIREQGLFKKDEAYQAHPADGCER